MKKYLWGLLTGIFLAGAIAVLAGETFFKGKVVYLLKDRSSIVTRPSSSGKTLTQIIKGTPMIVVENQPEWIKIAITGWLPKSVVTGDFNKLKGDPLQASMIVVTDRAAATAILQQIRAGGDFAKIAKEKSIDKVSGARGGDLGEFYPGDFAPEFEKPIMALKPGQVSEVVALQGRFHIFKRVK